MKKIIIFIAVLALVACLVVARLADQRTNVPQDGTSPSGNVSDTTEPSNLTPGDIENGLGWG